MSKTIQSYTFRENRKERTESLIIIFPKVVVHPSEFTPIKVKLLDCKKFNDLVKEIDRLPKKDHEILEVRRKSEKRRKEILEELFWVSSNSRGLYGMGEILILKMTPYVLLHELLHHFITILRLGKRFDNLLDRFMK